jgi:cysteine synthase
MNAPADRCYVTHLSCSKTGERYPAGQLHNLSAAGAPLLVHYDLDAIRQHVVKDEGRLPTGSFKARGLALAVSMAREFGLSHLAIPTNGNAGAAMAAYARRAGMRATVLCPADTPDINIREIRLQGADTYLVNGLINDCGRIVGEGKDKVGWFDVSTLKEPYRIEGKKTMGYELAEQLGWTLPDAIFYPTGGGTGLIGMWKAFAEGGPARHSVVTGPPGRVTSVSVSAWLYTVQGAQKGKQLANFIGVQPQRFQFLVAEHLLRGGDVVTYHRLQGREAPVMHVGGGAADVTQARHPEGREQVAARSLHERELRAGLRISVAVGAQAIEGITTHLAHGRQAPRIRYRVLAPDQTDVLELAVGQARTIVTTRALCALADEKRQAALLLRIEVSTAAHVAGIECRDVSIETRWPRAQRTLEGSQHFARTGKGPVDPLAVVRIHGSPGSAGALAPQR